MTHLVYRLRLRVWLHPGAGGWHFVTLPQPKAKEIRRRLGGTSRGWGSLPAVATVGATAWRTSIFPDAKSGSYLLPLKASVRAAEGIADGDLVTVELDLGPVGAQ